MTEQTTPLYGTYDAKADKAWGDENAEDGAFVTMKDEGEYVLRVMPPLMSWATYFASIGRPLTPFFMFWKHFFQVSATQNIAYPCPQLNTEYGFKGYPDPVCEKAKVLAGTGSPEDWEQAGDLKAKRRVIVNVIDRDRENKGPKIWEFGAPMGKEKGRTMWEKVRAKMSSSRNPRDLVHPINGYDIVVTKAGSGKQGTTYEIDVLPNSSPLHADQEVMENWIRSQHDLLQYITPPSPEQLRVILTGQGYWNAGKLIMRRAQNGAAQAPALDAPRPRAAIAGQQGAAPTVDMGSVIDSFAKGGDTGGIEF